MVASGAPARPLFGRGEVLEALRRHRDEARAGHGGVTLLEGEPGVGKTTVLETLLDEPSTSNTRVVRVRVASLDSPPPLYLIRAALRSSEDATDSRPTPPAAGSIPLAVGEFEGSILAGPLALGLLVEPEGPAVSRGRVDERVVEALRSPGESAESDRARLFASLARDFSALADRGPTVLALDDLHFADDSSLEFLEFLAPTLRDRPLWIVATSLPSTALSEARRTLLERIPKSSTGDRIVVPPLSATEVGEFVRWLDPDRETRREDVTRWHSESGGNPQFLELILRSGRRGPTVDDRIVDIHAPATELTAYLGQQIRRLSDEERRILDVASVLGSMFPFRFLWKTSGDDEERLAETVEHLVGAGFLLERAGERLAFARDELRVQVYSGLTETRRRILHRHAGEAMESTEPRDVATVFALARHYYLGKVDAKAVEYNRLAAQFAVRSVSSHVAIVHLRNALESQRRLAPGPTGAEVALILDLAVELDRVGELAEAERLLTDALQRPGILDAQEPRHRGLLRVYRARIVTDQGRWDDADRLTDPLLTELATGTEVPVRIALYRLKGEIRYYQGRYDESLQHHDAALALARSTGDEREIALETVRRANVLGMIPDRFEEAFPAYYDASETLLRLGDLGEAAYALLFLGVVLSQHERGVEGLVALRRAVELAERANDLRRVGWARFNIADLLADEARFDEAREENRRSREILERIGDRFGLAQTYIIGGKISVKAGDPRAGEIELLEAFRITRELAAEADELEVILRLAEAALAQGDRGTAQTRSLELERRGIRRLRPDLVTDHDRLVERLMGVRERNGAAKT